MHGPPLTPQEAVASVARQVLGLEAEGLDRDQAIRRVAFATRIDAEKVRWCTETAAPRLGRARSLLNRPPQPLARNRRRPITAAGEPRIAS
jgi:hypothetical protein